MMKPKYAIQILENLERCKEALMVREQFTKEEMKFSESLSKILGYDYPEEYESYLYNKAKAERYNIDWDYEVYDPVGLAQAIEEHEWLDKKDSYNQDREYYNRLGVR